MLAELKEEIAVAGNNRMYNATQFCSLNLRRMVVDEITNAGASSAGIPGGVSCPASTNSYCAAAVPKSRKMFS
jgi:hypothetical protein